MAPRAAAGPGAAAALEQECAPGVEFEDEDGGVCRLELSAPWAARLAAAAARRAERMRADKSRARGNRDA